MSARLVSGDGRGRWNFIYIFFRLFLGDSNAKMCGDHQKKNFFKSNSVEALIQFKEKHQGPLKLHVALEGGRRRNFL